jgi:hypothetical protein
MIAGRNSPSDENSRRKNLSNYRQELTQWRLRAASSNHPRDRQATGFFLESLDRIDAENSTRDDAGAGFLDFEATLLAPCASHFPDRASSGDWR